MGRKIRITEEQYKKFLKEVDDKTQVMSQGNDSNSIKKASDNAVKNGLPKEKFEVVAPLVNNNNQTAQLSTNDKNNAKIVVSEGKLITKKQLQENRLKELKKNSEVYTVKDFIKKFDK